MADKISPYRKYQDRNNDGLPDICVQLPADEVVCPPCIPNPNAVVRNWTKSSHLETGFNGKTCEHFVVVRTDYKDTGGADDLPPGWTPDNVLEARATEYLDMAIEQLLLDNAKLVNEENIEAVKGFIRFDPARRRPDWFLSIEPESRLKLRYRCKVEDLMNLQEEERDVEEPTAPNEVTYQINEFRMKLIKLSKGLSLYHRYHSVSKAIGEGKITFVESGKE